MIDKAQMLYDKSRACGEIKKELNVFALISFIFFMIYFVFFIFSDAYNYVFFSIKLVLLIAVFLSSFLAMYFIEMDKDKYYGLGLSSASLIMTIFLFFMVMF